MIWIELLPHVIRLFARSKLETHRKMTVGDICRKVIPALERGFYAYVFKSGELRAFAMWGFFSDEALGKWHDGTIQPHDWNSGPNIWLAEVIAEDGTAKALMRAARAFGRQSRAGEVVRFRRDNTGRVGAVRL